MYTTYIIIGITIAVSMIAFNNQTLYRDLMMNPYMINTRNQYYRFFSSGFIHGGHTHLLMNMITLYFFGTILEQLFEMYFGGNGQIYFIILYVLGIVVSDIPTYFKNIHNPGYNSLGASGGVSSIMFAFIMFRPLAELQLYFFIPLKGFIFAILYVVYSYYQGKKSGDNINHDAHLYGALFGILFCVVMRPAVVSEFFQQITAWRILE